MSQNKSIVVSWDRIKDFINPTIRKSFEKENSVDIEKYIAAESNVTAELRVYIPCFSSKSKGLSRIWASLFNFSFIGLANEKNDTGFSQITTNYNKAMDFLQSEEAKSYCNKSEETDIQVSDFMRFGNQKVVKF